MLFQKIFFLSSNNLEFLLDSFSDYILTIIAVGLSNDNSVPINSIIILLVVSYRLMPIVNDLQQIITISNLLCQY